MRVILQQSNTQRKLIVINKSGVVGVSASLTRTGKPVWIVKIKSQLKGDRNNVFIGKFKEKDDAVMARWEAERKHGYPRAYTDSSALKYLIEKEIIKEAFPPDYPQVFRHRIKILNRIMKNEDLQYGAKEYYKDKPIEFINDWGITFDPRNAGTDVPTLLPFFLFQRQKELIEFLLDCLHSKENGLIEKSRDMGCTWICCVFSLWLWLFSPGSSVGWGSRKETLVDKIGDADSIFEKIRMLINYLPKFFLPANFNPKVHISYMKIINPENGSTITGEAGDNIGRGGRKSIYFKDESAHYERPERIEAALGDNTNVQIDLSSVHGTGNVFARRREAGELYSKEKSIPKGKTRVFIFDWHDHPLKDQTWYNRRRAKAEEEGLLHLFNQEVDRNYKAAVDGLLIKEEWVKAAIDAHKVLGFEDDGAVIAGLDVADEGADKNAIAIRKGVVIRYISAWAQGDTGATARKAVSKCKEFGATSLQYDCIGVGAGVKAETNRLKREGIVPKSLNIVPWSAASKPLFPNKRVIKNDTNSPKNKDFYANLKAQGWWEVRKMFERTYKAVIQDTIEDCSKLISIPSNLVNLHELVNELCQPVYKYDGKGKIVIDKKPPGTRSPNLGDSFIMAYWPIMKGEVIIV